MPKGALPIGVLQVKGKTGRVNVSEPLLMPRHRKPADGIRCGCRACRWEAADAGRGTRFRSDDTVCLGV